MRVIAGSARRLLLKTLPGDETRPTTDKIKETLFNMINFDLPGARFLDLFAGSGAIGIEALSRGASRCVFVDNNPKAAAVIRDNLEHTHFTEVSEVITADVLGAVRRIERDADAKAYDIIFMDPPYDKGLEDGVLRALSHSCLANDDTCFIIETGIRSDTERFADMGYELVKIKEYRSNKHVFLKRRTS